MHFFIFIHQLERFSNLDPYSRIFIDSSTNISSLYLYLLLSYSKIFYISLSKTSKIDFSLSICFFHRVYQESLVLGHHKTWEISEFLDFNRLFLQFNDRVFNNFENFKFHLKRFQFSWPKANHQPLLLSNMLKSLIPSNFILKICALFFIFNP